MPKNQRKQFKFQNRVIYQWEQSLDSILVYIECPPVPQNIKKASVFDIKITADSLSVGIKGNPPYMKHEFKGIADTVQSLWFIQKNSQTKKQDLVIEIQKAQKGVRWGCVFKSHQNLNPLEQQQLKKKLMLQRFQQQHPGFDFSDAQFNGQVPEARSFMGGMKST